MCRGSHCRTIAKVNVKRKVVPVLFVTEHHAMKAYWGQWIYSSTHSALDGYEWYKRDLYEMTYTLYFSRILSNYINN
jgi:hypothetical protein